MWLLFMKVWFQCKTSETHSEKILLAGEFTHEWQISSYLQQIYLCKIDKNCVKLGLDKLIRIYFYGCGRISAIYDKKNKLTNYSQNKITEQ